MSLLKLLRASNNVTDEMIHAILSMQEQAAAVPLFLDSSRASLIGFVPLAVRDLIRSTPDASNALYEVNGAFEMNGGLRSSVERTEALETLLKRWRDDPKVLAVSPKKWRNERYSVWDSDGKIALEVERAVSGLFSMRSYGCHINGFLCQNGKPSKMWVARRSYSKQSYPGMLDNMVGGGLPHGVQPTANAIKECFEEAGISFSSPNGSKLKAVSVITHFIASTERGWCPDTEYLYDLEVQQDFIPVCQDGEVHGFELLDMDSVKRSLENGEFMPESGLCVLDFLLRHGFIEPESEPDYLTLSLELRRKLPFPGPM